MRVKSGAGSVVGVIWLNVTVPVVIVSLDGSVVADSGCDDHGWTIPRADVVVSM